MADPVAALKSIEILNKLDGSSARLVKKEPGLSKQIRWATMRAAKVKG